MINALIILSLTVLLVAAVLYCARLRRNLKDAKSFGKMAWKSMNVNADTVQKKQAELASAQKRVKRLERVLEKNNMAHLS